MGSDIQRVVSCLQFETYEGFCREALRIIESDDFDSSKPTSIRKLVSDDLALSLNITANMSTSVDFETIQPWMVTNLLHVCHGIDQRINTLAILNVGNAIASVFEKINITRCDMVEFSSVEGHAILFEVDNNPGIRYYIGVSAMARQDKYYLEKWKNGK